MFPNSSEVEDQNKPKKIFLTFSDKRLVRSKNRIVSQAESLDFFDQIYSWDESDLSQEFLDHFSQLLSANVRGFGFWSWKPQIILQALELCNEGDIILYSDVGFTINPKGILRLQDYFERANSAPTGIVAFQGRRPEYPMIDDGRELPTWPDKHWTKGDLFDYFSVRDQRYITDTPTIQAGLLLVRKCPESIAFISSWLAVFLEDIHLVDDSPSFSQNLSGFREHRHDQSVFSILGKIHSIDTYSSNEFWYPKAMSSSGDWDALSFSPFHATRSLDFGFIGNIKRKSLYYFNAFKPRNLKISFKLFITRMGKFLGFQSNSAQ